MSKTIKVVFWQTFGGVVEVPENKLKEFDMAVENNDTASYPEIMGTFDASHYEGEIVDVMTK